MTRSPALLVLALLLGGCTEAVLPPSETCALEAPTVPSWRLYAQGTTLRDALGRVVVLRGVNAGGRAKIPPYAPFDHATGLYQAALDAYLDRAAAWGIDTLRVPFVWAAAEPTKGAYDEAYLARYDALLDGVWARGMYTIVDFHQDVYAEAFCGDGFPEWTLPDPHPAPHHDCPAWGGGYLGNPGVRAAFDAFWADGSEVRAAFHDLWAMMAARHAARPGVIGFEPMNEPGWGTADMATWEATTLTAFHADVASRLRAVAPDALVFVDGTGVDGVLLETALTPPPGPGIVFAPHYYQAAALSEAPPNADRVADDLGKWARKGEAWNVPVLLGEFGVSNANPEAETYMRAHHEALDALGMSGTQWEYSTAVELWNGEDLSVAGPDGGETPAGRALPRPYARAVAGEAVSFSFDASSGNAVLRFRPSDGISEIVLPAAVYARGYDVEASGACADASRADRLLVGTLPGAAEVVVTVRRR